MEGDRHGDGRDLLIRGGHILTFDPTLGDIPEGDVLVRDGAIAAVGQHLGAEHATVIDASDHIVMPGFVDTHRHLWTSALRSLMVDGRPERQYFPVTVALGPSFTPDDTYAATRLGAAEGIAAGITTVHDWSHNVRGIEFARASISALRECGVRTRFSYGWAQRSAMDEPVDFGPIERVQADTAADQDGMTTLGFASRNLVPGQSLRGSIPVEIAQRDWSQARERGLPITLHASPPGLVTMLEQEQMLGPDLLLVHPLSTTARENAIVAGSGATWSMSVQSESGRGPQEAIQFCELESAGVRTSLSIDTTCTDTADMFAAMRTLYLASTHRLGNAAHVTARRMLELATIEGARALGLDEYCGSVVPGKRADLILVDRMAPNMAPPGDPVTQLLLFAQPRNVDTVLIDGRVVYSPSGHATLDVAEVVAEAIISQRAVCERAQYES